MLRRTIMNLLVLCRPLAIGWLVIAVVVYSVNGLPNWPRTHVCEEVREAIWPTPSFAYSNPSTPIPMKCMVITVVAPPDDGLPSAVFPAVVHSVFCNGSLHGNYSHTSTRRRVSHNQGVMPYLPKHAAIAFAQPSPSVLTRPIAFTNDCECAKLLTRQIDVLHTGWYTSVRA